jgi:hypothetical protein
MSFISGECDSRGSSEFFLLCSPLENVEDFPSPMDSSFKRLPLPAGLGLFLTFAMEAYRDSSNVFLWIAGGLWLSVLPTFIFNCLILEMNKYI